MPELLELRAVTKTFGGVHALDSVDFSLRRGEIHALVGENGAGKSTLIKVVTGAHSPDSGSVRLDGEELTGLDPAGAKALGIAVIYQQPALLSELTVAENLTIGSDGPWISWRRRHARARELLAAVRADIDPGALAKDLSLPQQQLVEIARALRDDPRVLILDEPTATLPEADAEHLLGLVQGLRDSGTGIVYISHRLEELFRIADRVTVLRDGQHVATSPMEDVDRETLIRQMVGRDVADAFPAAGSAPGAVRLAVRGLSSASAELRDIDLEIRAGEVLGLAGLVGAGRTELAEALFGLRPIDSGTVAVDGAAVAIKSPADALRAGIACLPEDRRRHGVILDMSIVDNVTLPILRRFTRRGLVRARDEAALAGEFKERMAVKAASLFAAVGTLSGGNQQKVALSRWLATEPRVLILDEPTQGIDVGSRAQIHELIRELADGGLAVLLVSSDLPEVLGMSDRVAVMRGGRIAAVLERGEATREEVLHFALGEEVPA